MIVDISSEFPAEYIESKIVEVFEAVEKCVSCLDVAMYGFEAEITEFEFCAEGDEPVSSICADAFDFTFGDA